MTKRIISVVLAVVMLVCMSTNVFASNKTDSGLGSKALYISSESAPSSADEFARDQFAHFNAGTFAAMGFSADEAANMHLAPAFKALPFKSNITIADNIYHYPIITNNKIVGILKITYIDNRYNYQLEFSEFARLLNDLTTTDKSPAKIVLSDNAYFAVTDSDVDILQTFGHTDSAALPGESASVRSITEQASVRSQNVVEIGINTVFTEKVKTAATRYPRNFFMPVPIVSNTYQGSPAGVCWAACIGSLAAFVKFGSMQNENAIACIYRDDMITHFSQNYPGSGMTDDDVVIYYTNMYAGYITYRYAKTDWQTLNDNLLIVRRPFIVGWAPYFAGNPGHLTVLCGAEYDSEYPDDQSYYRIAVMDPNRGYVIMGYNDSFVDGTYIAYWMASFR